jgi:hypothetical protein
MATPNCGPLLAGSGGSLTTTGRRIHLERWRWIEPTASLRSRRGVTRRRNRISADRLSLVDRDGHPPDSTPRARGLGRVGNAVLASLTSPSKWSTTCPSLASTAGPTRPAVARGSSSYMWRRCPARNSGASRRGRTKHSAVRARTSTLPTSQPGCCCGQVPHSMKWISCRTARPARPAKRRPIGTPSADSATVLTGNRGSPSDSCGGPDAELRRRVHRRGPGRDRRDAAKAADRTYGRRRHPAMASPRRIVLKRRTRKS